MNATAKFHAQTDNVFGFPQVELIFRPCPEVIDLGKVNNSKDLHRILRLAYNEDTIALYECFYVVYLNHSMQVKGVYKLSQGGITGTVADPRLIMTGALLTGATGMALSHNHPSGKMAPSEQDIKITQKVKEVCKFLDIQLLDHLILSPYRNEYYSFADEGAL